MPIKSVKIKKLFLSRPGITQPKNQLPRSKSVTCSLRTDTHTDRVTTEGTLSGFQDFRIFSFNLSTKIGPKTTKHIPKTQSLHLNASSCRYANTCTLLSILAFNRASRVLTPRSIDLLICISDSAMIRHLVRYHTIDSVFPQVAKHRTKLDTL